MMLLIYLIGCVAFVAVIVRRILSFEKTPDGFYLPKKCVARKCSHDKELKCLEAAHNLGLAYSVVGTVLAMFVGIFPGYGLYWLLKIDILVGK